MPVDDCDGQPSGPGLVRASGPSLAQQRYDMGHRPTPGMQPGKVIHSIDRTDGGCTPNYARNNPDPPAPTDIRLRPPTKYTHKSNVYQTKRFDTPLRWLSRTWTMTHSTQSKWLQASSVRTTFSCKFVDNSEPPFYYCKHFQELVEVVDYEKRGFRMSTPSISVKPNHDLPSWKRRGKGWRKVENVQWEILGWGERQGPEGLERWLVIWTDSGLLSKEGVDIYCDRPEGLGEETFDEIMKSLYDVLDAPKFARFLRENLKEVEVQQPCRPRESEDSILDLKMRLDQREELWGG